MTKNQQRSMPRKKKVKARMKTNHAEDNWNVGKWSPLRVRVLESQCNGFNPFCSINRRGIR